MGEVEGHEIGGTDMRRLRLMFPLRTVITIVTGTVMLAAVWFDLNAKVNQIDRDRARDKEEISQRLSDVKAQLDRIEDRLYRLGRPTQ